MSFPHPSLLPNSLLSFPLLLPIYSANMYFYCSDLDQHIAIACSLLSSPYFIALDLPILAWFSTLYCVHSACSSFCLLTHCNHVFLALAESMYVCYQNTAKR